MPNPDDSPRLGLHVLLVEDDTLLASMLADGLEALGCTSVRATRVTEASQLAESENPDVAILDVNVAGEQSYPIAEILARRDIPFIFVTGYIKTDIPAQFRNRPMLFKPFHLADLEEALRRNAKAERQPAAAHRNAKA
jgi:DNA-binding response OmpR family regulator